MKAVEDILLKLKNLEQVRSQTIQVKEELEAKLLIDGLLDEVREGILKELESVNLKIRWVNDEKKTLFADLDEALRILDEKTKFIELQKEDIKTLLEQIEHTKSLIKEKIEEI